MSHQEHIRIIEALQPCTEIIGISSAFNLLNITLLNREFYRSLQCADRRGQRSVNDQYAVYALKVRRPTDLAGEHLDIILAYKAICCYIITARFIVAFQIRATGRCKAHMMTSFAIIRESLDKLVQQDVIHLADIAYQQLRMYTILIHIARAVVRIFCNLIVNRGVENQLVVELYPRITGLDTVDQSFHRHVLIASLGSFGSRDLEDQRLGTQNDSRLCGCFHDLIIRHGICRNRDRLTGLKHEHVTE